MRVTRSTDTVSMGNFYTNVTVRGPRREDIQDALKALDCPAYLSPTVDGVTVMCDRRSEPFDDQIDACEDDVDDGSESVACEGTEEAHVLLARALSERLHCVALALRNHDDDVLEYYLYEAGELRDRYNSMPDFGEQEGGLGMMLALLASMYLPLPRCLKRWVVKRAMPRSPGSPAWRAS